MQTRLLFLVTVILALPLGAVAQPLPPEEETLPEEELKRYLIVSGWTQHFRIPSDDRVNSFLAGLGYRQEFSRDEDRIWSVYAGFYNDSRSIISTNVGVECQLRTDFVDFGLAGGLMYNPRFKEAAGTPVIPYALPYLHKQIDRVGLRLYYSPPIPGHEYTEQVIFQMHLEI